MKAARHIVLFILSSILSTPSLSESAETDSPSQTASSAGQPYIPVVVYTGFLVARRGTDKQVSIDPVIGMGNEEPSARKLKIYRAEGLGMASNRSGMLLNNDNASLTLKAPMPRVNGVLSLVGTLYQTQLDSTAIRWVQALSLLSTRKIDAEFSYSAKVSNNSSFDSAISCKLHPGEAGNAELRADFRYTLNF